MSVLADALLGTNDQAERPERIAEWTFWIVPTPCLGGFYGKIARNLVQVVLALSIRVTLENSQEIGEFSLQLRGPLHCHNTPSFFSQ